MRIDNRLASSTVNGPGDRAVIWVNGCTLGCKGCWNPETHKASAFKTQDIGIIADWVIENAKDGLTFSGGEPMQQAHEVKTLMQIIHSQRPNFSIGMYTGYTKKELEQGRYEVYNELGLPSTLAIGKSTLWYDIKPYLDFAIMGRFNQQQLDTTRPYCSSRNQEIKLFSDRYTLDDFGKQEIEFQISEDGLIQITGFPVGLTSIQDLSAFELGRDW